MIQLKPLSYDAIPAALAKAERYRLLNEPAEAESICQDILSADPDNQQALITLVLALTDQFDHELAVAAPEAASVLRRIRDDYAREYYSGIACERRAKTQLRRNGPGSDAAAYEYLTEAMAHYERAEAIRPVGNDDALLRWNTCARVLIRNPRLASARDEYVEPYLE